MGLDSRDYYKPSGLGGFSYFPPVLKILLMINVAVFFIQMLFDNVMFGGYPGAYILNRYFALNPIGGFDQAGFSYNFQVWQLITYQFMHGSFSHILFNMFMLWMFGMEIENIMGSKKFLIFYLASGVGAGLLQILASPFLESTLAPTIGASGAVYGVMIAFAMFFPDRYIFLYFLIPVKAKYLIAFLVVFEFLSINTSGFVAHLAHIGGALTALIFILSDRKNNFNFNRMFSSFKKPSSSSRQFSSGFRKPKNPFEKDVQEAKYYDINDKNNDEPIDASQEEIDRILDKISQSGYQKLTDHEKKVLFEASKMK